MKSYVVKSYFVKDYTMKISIMKSFFLNLFMFFHVLLVVPVYGHTGHDHSHWEAEILHYIFYISTAFMIAVVIYCMVLLLTANEERSVTRENRRGRFT